MPAKSTAKKTARKAVATVARAARGMTFTLPFAGSVKEPRPSSKRAKVLEMLTRPQGATHEEVMKAVGWDRITAYEGIRLLSKHNGYGLREDDKGRIHAYKEREKKTSRTRADA